MTCSDLVIFEIKRIVENSSEVLYTLKVGDGRATQVEGEGEGGIKGSATSDYNRRAY